MAVSTMFFLFLLKSADKWLTNMTWGGGSAIDQILNKGTLDTDTQLMKIQFSNLPEHCLSL